MEITWWLNDQPWFLYILVFLAWSLSTFSVSLPSLDLYIVPSVNQLSITFIPGLLADLLVHDLEQIYHLVELPATNLISTWVRMQLVFTLLSPPCVPYLNTGDCCRGLLGACAPRSGGQEDSNLLIKFLQTTYDVLEYLWDICHLFIIIPVLYYILSYISILWGWRGDNGSIPTDQRSKVCWINFILIQFNFRNISWVVYYNSNLGFPVVISLRVITRNET